MRLLSYENGPSQIRRQHAAAWKVHSSIPRDREESDKMITVGSSRQESIESPVPCRFLLPRKIQIAPFHVAESIS